MERKKRGRLCIIFPLNSKITGLQKVFATAYNKAKNCTCGGEEADTSCYSCLRSYQNQRNHDLIKRKYVIEYFKELHS